MDWQLWDDGRGKDYATVLNLPSRTFRQNTRVIYVDRGNGTGGGVFSQEAEFSVLVDNDLSTDEVQDLTKQKI